MVVPTCCAEGSGTITWTYSLPQNPAIFMVTYSMWDIADKPWRGVPIQYNFLTLLG